MEKKQTVKDMPLLERPYEKCITFGPQSLSDAELLAVILKTGAKDKTSIDLARDIMNLALEYEENQYEGLAAIQQLDLEQLKTVRGIGDAKAVQILCLGEIASRISKSAAKNRMVFRDPSSIADYFMEEMRYLNREEVRILLFDGKHALIGESCISIGTVNMSLSSPREVFLEALKKQAVYIIMVHNHPSGDPGPSKADSLLTKKMEQAGKLIGIELSDHIIIGNHNYYSFRENGFFS